MRPVQHGVAVEVDLSARYRVFDSIAALTNNINGFAHSVEHFEMAGHALCRPRVSDYSNQRLRF